MTSAWCTGDVPARRGPSSDTLELPAGFRFFPSDEELVVHYLSRKAESQPFPVPIIAEVDLYKFDPWDLPEKALFGEKEWYFFSPRDRKYPNGSRPNRAAGCGYWKATGTDKPIVVGGSSRRTVGVKKALVFYTGKAPKGDKTNWIMHEYRLADAAARAARCKGSTRLDDWVLCRIYKKLPSAARLQAQAAAAAMNEASGSRLGADHVEPRAYIDENLASGDGGGGGARPRQLLWHRDSPQAETFAYYGAQTLDPMASGISPESHESSPVDSSVVDDDGVHFLLDSLPNPFVFSARTAPRQPYLPFSF